MHIYIKTNEILSFDFELDSRYNIGDTYEDYNQGKYVRLSDDRVAFMNEHKDASIREIWDMKLNPPYTPTIEDARSDKLLDIGHYDTSEAVNSFTLADAPMWLDKTTRVGLMNSIGIEKKAGKTETVLWFDGNKYVIPVDTAIQMLNALELYALDCYNVTQSHIAAVNALQTVEEIGAYDHTSGYPEKLVFG